MESLAIPAGARALHTHRVLMRASLGVIIFAWLFIFQLFFVAFGFEHALFSVALLYGFVQVLVFFLTPLSAPALRFGVRRALAFGTLLGAFMLTTAALMFIPKNPVSFFALLSIFVLFMALQRALYWVPYHSISPETSRLSVPEYILWGVPLCAGVLLTIPGFGPYLFIAASVLALAALLPLIAIPERVEAFDWSVFETFRMLFIRKNRAALLSGVLDGVQGVALLLFWPLSVFLIVSGDWLLIGFVFSVSLFFTHFLRSRIQRWLKIWHAERSDTMLAILTLSAWGARLTAPAPLAIVAADIFSGTTISPKRFHIDIHAGEQAADGGHFLDEYTALKEMSLCLGRALACLIFMVLVSFSGTFALAASLALAGFSSVVSLILARRAARTL